MDGRLVRLTVCLVWSLRVVDLGEFRVDEWGVTKHIDVCSPFVFPFHSRFTIPPSLSLSFSLLFFISFEKAIHVLKDIDVLEVGHYQC